MKRDFIFTSESVTEGHPDKLCDQISDAVVDRFLQHNPGARVIAECAVANAVVFMAIRFACEGALEFSQIARQVIAMAGYDQRTFDSKSCSIITSLAELPLAEEVRFPDEALTDEEIERIPAGNQVTVFGFACDQSSAYLPVPIYFAHRLARRLASVRLQKILPYLAPDGKVQVGIEYHAGVPRRVHSITVLASQHRGGEPPLARLREEVREAVIGQVFGDEEIAPDDRTQISINHAGAVVAGGPVLHAGLTGRKSAIDLYGGYARQSGAALSGKDPTGIDRVAAYAARYAAKNLVVAGLARECEVQLSYSLAQARPVSIQVETFGSGALPDERLAALVGRCFEFRLAGIVRQFNLRRLPVLVKGGFYRKLAAYGHVGRMDMGLPWEVTDRVELLRELARR